MELIHSQHARATSYFPLLMCRQNIYSGKVKEVSAYVDKADEVSPSVSPVRGYATVTSEA